MNKILILIKTYKKWSVAGGFIIVVALFFVFRGNNKTKIEMTVVKSGSIEQIVSVTGRVTPTDDLELSFEKSGKIAAVNVIVGQHVAAGQILLQQDASELYAQRLGYSAGVQQARAKLNQLIAGTRIEEINAAQVTFDNAEKSLYETRVKNAIDTARTALNVGINALVSASDIQYKNSSETIKIAQNKDIALGFIYETPNLGSANSWYFLSLESGLVKKLADAKSNPTNVDTKDLLTQTKKALLLVQDVIDPAYSAIYADALATDAQKTSIGNARSNVLAQISAVTTQEQAIVSAENTLDSARAQLDLKKAPATSFDVEIAKSNLTQAQANLALIDAQINKMIIRSPVVGVVILVDKKKGEIAGANINVVSVISDAKFDIEAYVPESDIGKVKITNPAKITFDTYGSDIVFGAKVVSINPAATILDGVATYKTTFEFTPLEAHAKPQGALLLTGFTNQDQRIFPGLTANIDIQTAKKDSVLFIPTRNVIFKGEKKFVRIVTDEKILATTDVEVQTGVRGSDGRTEIVSGLKKGQKIVNE